MASTLLLNPDVSNEEYGTYGAKPSGSSGSSRALIYNNIVAQV